MTGMILILTCECLIDIELIKLCFTLARLLCNMCGKYDDDDDDD